MVPRLIYTDEKGGFIVAVNDAQKGEIECHWTRDLLPSRVPTSFTPSTRLLIGSNTGLFHTNRDCQTTIASVEGNLSESRGREIHHRNIGQNLEAASRNHAERDHFGKMQI